MSQNNGNSKYVQWGAGWLKNNKAGVQYISGVAGDKQSGLKLVLKNAQGEEVEVSSFAVFFNENKKKPNHPDVRFVFTPGQEQQQS